MTVCVESVAEVRAQAAEARRRGLRIGLVPTMGALHEGHASLIRAARAECGWVAVSIFVNPTQFGPGEDFARYPRPLEADAALCRREGIDLVFAPSAAEMYPAGFATAVRVAGLSEKMCGAFRPGHFDGVCTVVAKLFALVQPDAAYFGEKDAQQLAIVRRMAADLNLPVEVRGCPTVREPDGLAMSSRNAYLSPGERRQALALPAALAEARRAMETGERDAARLAALVRQRLAAAKGVELQYVAVVDPDTLEDLAIIGGQVLVALAARVGTTRLIDNVLLRRLPDPRANRTE
ncbi:MAG: pantoate--beta-alanine ligase [Planctomycetes bacterium]|nr:pantoate--beta-alanine ligase [Planctomycetota bacterium]